jgi:hypothetical protein
MPLSGEVVHGCTVYGPKDGIHALRQWIPPETCRNDILFGRQFRNLSVIRESPDKKAFD